MAALETMADRLNIATKNNRLTPFSFSTQSMINCNKAGSCWGGAANYVFEWAKKEGLPEESCMAYLGKNLGTDCKPINLCSECSSPIPKAGEHSENCYAVNYTKYFISDRFGFFGRKKMMQEIYAHGPITCNIWWSDKLQDYKEGIFYEKGPRLYSRMNHSIEVVGYG
jgi:cathepsin X